MSLDRCFPPLTSAKYKNFNLLYQGSYYKIFKAESNDGKTKCNVRVLDLDSETVEKDYNRYASLFIQEILRFATAHGQLNSIIIEDFELSNNRMAFITTPYHSLDEEIIQESSVESLLMDILSDINFVHEKMKLSELTISTKTIFRLEAHTTFFLGDWGTGIPEKELKTISKTELAPNKHTHDGSGVEGFMLGIAGLMAMNLEIYYIERLLQEEDESSYEFHLEKVLLKLKESPAKYIFKKILQKDVRRRCNVDRLAYLQIPTGKCSNKRI